MRPAALALSTTLLAATAVDAAPITYTLDLTASDIAPAFDAPQVTPPPVTGRFVLTLDPLVDKNGVFDFVDITIAGHSYNQASYVFASNGPGSNFLIAGTDCDENGCSSGGFSSSFYFSLSDLDLSGISVLDDFSYGTPAYEGVFIAGTRQVTVTPAPAALLLLGSAFGAVALTRLRRTS